MYGILELIYFSHSDKNQNKNGSTINLLNLNISKWLCRSYALTSIYEAAIRPDEESLILSTSKVESDEADSKEVVLPGVNLLFDGSGLRPFDIAACLQARVPVSLVFEASAASASSMVK